MIRQLFRAINCNFIQKDVRNLQMIPSYFVRGRSPFNFYSFEEEIHKLKLLQEQQKNKQQNYRKGVSPLVKQSIEDLNTLYREHNMLNFEVDQNFQSKRNNQSFRQKVKNREDLQSFQHLKIQSAIKIAYIILDNQNKTKENQLNNYEQAMVLEVFFYNILLSFLCEQPEIFQKILNKQENGPLIDEIYVIKSFMSYFFSMPNCIDIVSESPQLFKFIVKTAEILQINQEVVIPFIQQFLNKTSQEGIYYKSLYDITMIFLPISDYMAESRFNLLKIGQLDNSKALDIGNISLIVRQLLNIKESNNYHNKRNVSREEIGNLCKLFFCLVRVNQGRGKVCLDLSEAILTSNFEYLTEIEMTSVIYSLIKLEYNKNTEVSFERKIKREMPNLIFDYETKIEKMLQTGYFNHARIPYILYCLQKTSKFRPQYRKTQVQYICQNLIQIVMKNYEKYQAQEIVTIIYSLKVISPSFQKEIEDLYRAYFLKLAIEQQKREVNQKQLQENNNKTSDEEDEAPKTQDNKGNTPKQQEKNNKNEANKKSKIETLQDSKQDDQDDAQFLNNYMNQEYLSQEGQDVQISKIVKENQSNNNNELKNQNNNQQKKEKQNVQLVSNKQQKIQGYNIKMQKMRNTFQYFQQLQGLDILCLFIGIRNFNKNQNKHTKEKLNSIFIINQQLFKLFLSKLNYINDHLKIKILYEVSYNHPELLDSYLFEKNFQDWIISIEDNLHKLNNFDFIALGFIMKKYARLFAYHIEFWKKYADESSRRKFQGTLENQRIKVVHSNMSDFYQKCLNSSSVNQKQEVMRINKVRIAYEKINYFLENQGSIEYDGEQSNQNEDLDIDSFEQYR